EQLNKWNGQSAQYGLEAAIARAYLQLQNNQPLAARDTMTNHELLRPNPPDLIQGTWLRYWYEVGQGLMQRSGGFGGGFGNGPPGGGPRPEPGGRRFGAQEGPPNGGGRGGDRRGPGAG